MSKAIYFAVDPFPVSVCVMTEEKHLSQEVKRLNINIENNRHLDWKQYGGRVTRLDNLETDATLLLVMIDAKGLLDEDIGTRVSIYAHEATHVYQFIMDAIDEEEPGQEIEAYVIGHITSQIFNILEKALVKTRH
jgi:hypothetical protein